MKTTLDLPDALVREIKLRAKNEGRKLKDVVADLLEAGLAPARPVEVSPSPVMSKNLSLIPLRPVQEGDERTFTTQEWCDWIKGVDLQGDTERYEKAFGHQHMDRVDD